jgi:hypothetical protein
VSDGVSTSTIQRRCAALHPSPLTMSALLLLQMRKSKVWKIHQIV